MTTLDLINVLDEDSNLNCKVFKDIASYGLYLKESNVIKHFSILHLNICSYRSNFNTFFGYA